MYEGATPLDFYPIACFPVAAGADYPDSVVIVGNRTDSGGNDTAVVIASYNWTGLGGFTPNENFGGGSGESVPLGTASGVGAVSAARDPGNGSIYIQLYNGNDNLVRITAGGVLDKHIWRRWQYCIRIQPTNF